MNFVIGGNQNIIFASGIGSNFITYRPDFLPTNIPNLLSWYSSDYGVYSSPGVLATEGQAIRIWENKINNGVNLEQSGPLQPILSGGAIIFSQHAMSGTNPIALSMPLHYYLATKTTLSGNSSSTPATIIKQGSTILSTNIRYSFTVNTGKHLGARNPTLINTQNLTLNNNKNVIYAFFSGTDLATIGINNSSETITGIGTSINSNTVFTVGSNSATSSASPLIGELYEILIYTGIAHTISQQNQIINYLTNKWGVSI